MHTLRQWPRRVLRAVSLKTRGSVKRARQLSVRPSLEGLEVRAVPSINPAIGAGIAGRTYHHGNRELSCTDQHGLDVMLLPGDRAHAGIRPERHRPAIATTGIAGYHVWLCGNADLEAAELRGCKAQMPVRAENAQAPIGTVSLCCVRRAHRTSLSSWWPLRPNVAWAHPRGLFRATRAITSSSRAIHAIVFSCLRQAPRGVDHGR